MPGMLIPHPMRPDSQAGQGGRGKAAGTAAGSAPRLEVAPAPVTPRPAPGDTAGMAPVSEFSLCPELLASNSSPSGQLEAQRGDSRGWGQVGRTAGRLDRAQPTREWDTETWRHPGASGHPAAMPSGPSTALGTRRGTPGCPPCTVWAGFTRPLSAACWVLGEWGCSRALPCTRAPRAAAAPPAASLPAQSHQEEPTLLLPEHI